MAIILGNIIAFTLLFCLGISLFMALKFWKTNGVKKLLVYLSRGLIKALLTFVLATMLSVPFMTRCLRFTFPLQIYLILFVCLILFVGYSNSKKFCTIISAIYILIFVLLTGPGKVFGQYFYSPNNQRLRSAESFEAVNPSIVYPSGWLENLPIKDAVLDYWGYRPTQKDGTNIIIKPAILWHSCFTGLYAIDAKSVRIWFPGGTISEGISKLEFREQREIPLPKDCLSNC